MKYLILFLTTLSLTGCHTQPVDLTHCSYPNLDKNRYTLKFSMTIDNNHKKYHGKMIWHIYDNSHSIIKVFGPAGIKIANINVNTSNLTTTITSVQGKQHFIGDIKLNIDDNILTINPRKLLKMLTSVPPLNNNTPKDEKFNLQPQQIGEITTDSRACFRGYQWPKHISWNNNHGSTITMSLISVKKSLQPHQLKIKNQKKLEESIPSPAHSKYHSQEV